MASLVVVKPAYGLAFGIIGVVVNWVVVIIGALLVVTTAAWTGECGMLPSKLNPIMAPKITCFFMIDQLPLIDISKHNGVSLNWA